MPEKRWGFKAGLLTGFLGALLVLAVIGLIVIYTGAYNVAATDGHTRFARWALDTTMHNSVRSHADLVEPPELTPADLRTGAHEFAEYCAHCHGAPGVRPAEWTTGMLPNPPRLSNAAQRWSTGEIFWIVKNGVKMTGMPPFGPGHDDRTIWSIAAFVDRLPAMSPEEYRALTGGAGGGHSH